MKLTELPTEDFARIVSIISPAIGRLTRDERLVALFMRLAQIYKGDKNTTAVIVGITDVLPELLSKHATDVYTIIAAMSGKEIDDVKRQPIPDTVRDIYELLDMDITSFFGSAANAARAD